MQRTDEKEFAIRGFDVVPQGFGVGSVVLDRNLRVAIACLSSWVCGDHGGQEGEGCGDEGFHCC